MALFSSFDPDLTIIILTDGVHGIGIPVASSSFEEISEYLDKQLLIRIHASPFVL